jgi:ATP-dependent RNA helicase DbpA
MSSFETLSLRPPLKTALKRLAFTSMTPIQKEAIPLILENKDIVAKAATGSGKTLAFALGILERINPKFFGAQALILCPTRELAEQVATVIRSLASDIGNIKVLTLCGGVPMKGQIHSLKHGAHILVGTPGRILKLLQMETFDPSSLRYTVLDEADQMVDMGFIDDINAIFGYTPPSRQTLLFSATFPESVHTITDTFMKNAVHIEIEHTVDKPKIKEIAYRCDDKLSAIPQLLRHHAITNTILFCNTKAEANTLCEELNARGIHATLFHGDLEQFERNETIIQFRNFSIPILVATDLVGRGIDIDGLDAIFNVDIPTHLERYTHRIGRTGRAGREGLAISLVGDYQIERFSALDRSVVPIELPSLHYGDKILAPMRSVCIDAGKKEKLRPGDIVGALIHECGLDKTQIGVIDQLDHLSYVALPRDKAEIIYDKFKNRPIKGRIFRKWLLD